MLEKIHKMKMIDNKLILFFDKLSLLIENKELSRLLLSNRKNKKADLKNIIVTIVSLKEGYFLNFIYRYNTKDITKNYSIEDGIELLKSAIENDFYNADVYSKTAVINLIIKQNGKVQLRMADVSCDMPISFSHDKIKERLIKTTNNIYLEKLGIVDSNWAVRKNMNDKYRQINRYIELLKPYLTDKLLFNNCHIVDMGSGKGYLTFALYDYITNILKKRVCITGVELREELVSQCNDIAKESKFNDLNFIHGTIKEVNFDKIDILIALHACDTATDDAIYRGMKSNSSLIVCVPCCHKQVRNEFFVSNYLNGIIRHGILAERQAEIVTDGLRAMLLEVSGYKTSVFEFISTEHTPKNVMIVAEKTGSSDQDKQQILNDITSIKHLYGIKKHYLETLLDDNN
jgi:SAM-dependent methyltransferase